MDRGLSESIWQPQGVADSDTFIDVFRTQQTDDPVVNISV